MISTRRTLTVGLSALAALVVACGSSETAANEPTATSNEPTSVVSDDSSADDPLAGAFTMGGADLGGNSATEVLSARLLGFTPDGAYEWVAHEITLEPGEQIDHTHEFAFVYAAEGPHTFLLTGEGGTEVGFQQGEGRAIGAGESHRHSGGQAGDSSSTYWEIRLVQVGANETQGFDDDDLVFRSGELEGVPEDPAAAFVQVTVPPGGETSVHTHPGPEFIYQYSGVIDYENEFQLIEGFQPGRFEGIPARTAVQKRNISTDDSIFLSWFLVDPELPFASPALFAHQHEDGGRGPNLALPENGGSVSDFSSSFGRGTADSPFGANSAIDGDPGTEWSSFNDGDDAFIEISLAERTHVTSLGFWTRTMGTSAEIISFVVETDTGETHGPFELDGASAIKYVETDLVATTLKFSPAESSGGNVGAIEIEIYGESAS